MRHPSRCPVFLLPLLLFACGPLPDPRQADVDLRPPRLEWVVAAGPQEIDIRFDEEAGLCDGKTRITPPLAITEVAASGTSVVLKGETQVPGQAYALEAEAQDARGNTASFVAQFYGFNGRVPRLLINELTPRGSGNHPDIVELKALSAGNMGGVVLYLGTPGSYDARFVFPAVEVSDGGYILVHLKPTGDPGEIDETGDITASGGLDASATAYDFWPKDGKGLGANNGVLSVYTRPGGAFVDGVIYSNRTSQSDELYGGFGSEEMRARAEELVQDGGWKAGGQRVVPEDAVNPEGSTGTRSICRSSVSDDTDRLEDWHIVPTRGSSFGAENSDEVYTP